MKTLPESAPSIYPRRNLLKYAVIAGLGLFAPVVILIRRMFMPRFDYEIDQISERIPIPEDVQGQMGFKATVSQDGRMLAVAGNPVMQTNLLGKNSGQVPDGAYLLALALRTHIFVAEAPFTHFRFLWKNSNTSFVSSFVISPVRNDRLAAIIYEIPFEHLGSLEEAKSIYHTEEKKSQYWKDMKQAWDKGYDSNIYLIDTNTGDCKKLANIFSGKNPTANFTHALNESALAWNSAGNLLFSHDYDYIFSIDLSGQRRNIFSLKNYGIFSSLYCDSADTLSMVVIEKLGGEKFMRYDGPSYFIQIDSNGKQLKKEKFSCPPGYDLEEQNITFVGKETLRFFVIAESSVLHEISRIPNIPQQRSEGEWNSTVFYDPSEARFYYTVCGELPESGDIFFAKKRLVNDTVTARTNAVPWVDLRRLSPHSIDIL